MWGATLEAQQCIHDAFELSTVTIEVKDPSSLRTGEALLVEEHFVEMLRASRACSEQLTLDCIVILGQDFDASRPDPIMFGSQMVICASEIPVHDRLPSRSFRIKVRSCS